MRNNISKIKAVIIDIDGVICDVGLNATPETFTWEDFIEADLIRTNLQAGVDLAKSLQRENYIIFLTARPERMRRQTTNMLNLLGFFAFDLQMTSDCQADNQVCSDYRTIQATQKKSKTLQLQEHFDIVLAVDDQEENCVAFRDCGIPAIKAMFI